MSRVWQSFAGDRDFVKVAVVGPTYPHRGGIVHYTLLLGSHLSQRHATRVYGFKRLYPSWLFPGRSQIDPSEMPLVDVAAQRWLIPWWPPTWRRVWRDWSVWRPDVVVFQWWVPFLAPMMAWLAARARRLGVKVVMLCHNVLPHERNFLDHTLVKLALRQADQLIVHGELDRSLAQSLLPRCCVDVVAFPSYADFRSGTWPRDRARAEVGVEGSVLLFFGLVRPYKGLLDLLDALPAILVEIDATLLVVGEIWGDAQIYRERVRKLGIDAHVRFVDRYVSNEEATMYFSAADLAVLPYREATGSAVLQLAFGLGLPVVATRAGGMSEAVEDGVTGFLVEPGDGHGLSRAILRFFQDGYAEQMRDALRRYDPNVSWERVIAVVERVAQGDALDAAADSDLDGAGR